MFKFPIGITSSKRFPQSPEVPTIAEAGIPGYAVDSWNGLFAPAGTLAEIVNRVSAAVQLGFKDPALRKRMEDIGATPVGDTPEQFRALVQSELQKWGNFVRQTGIKFEQQPRNRPSAKDSRMDASNQVVIDTSFRAALRRMQQVGRINTYAHEADTEYQIAGMMKKLDGGPALLFPQVRGHSMPVLGNMLSCKDNCEAAFGVDYRGIRQFVARALGNPVPPVRVAKAPVHENVHRTFDLGKILPVLRHTDGDSGRFITAGIVVVQDPETGVYNASYHRLQVIGPQRTAIKLDFGRHLRAAFERAQKMGKPLPIAVCIGTDLAVHYTAATMGTQMPESADELAIAGTLRGEPIPVVKGLTQDIHYPAETEIVLEGVLLPNETVREGPFGEFVGYLSPEGDAPVFEITALAHRNNPVYFAINGVGRETIMLRKYVMEASLLKVLQAATPIVQDVEMTAGGLHRFHAVIRVKKTNAQQEGLQRNAILAAFGTLKDLDLVIAVDDDINIQDPNDVEYALAMRMEASKDLFIVPGARTHEYVRKSNNGIRAKVGIDATVPFEERARFERAPFRTVDVGLDAFSNNGPASVAWLK